MKIRFDRWLAMLVTDSRSEAGKLIRSGRVAVDGETLRDPAAHLDTESVRLALDGKLLDGRLTRHVMLYKPAGLLTAARDRKRPTVMDLVDPVLGRIGCMPVGRLDKDTTGLLLLTCDGELNHRLLSPAHHVGKDYRALVRGRLGEEAVRAFAEGIVLSDFTAEPAELRILRTGEETSLAEVTITEGKFHQVRRMFAAAGHEVLELHRFRFGPLNLDGSLLEGEWRELRPEEVQALYRAAGMEKV